MKKQRSFFLLVFIFFSGYFPLIAAPLSLSFSNGLLTLHCNNVELRDLLKDISQKTGIRIRLGGDTSGVISKDIDRVPLEKALHEILQGRNYLLMSEETPEGDKLLSILTPGKGSPVAVGGQAGVIERKRIKSPGAVYSEVSATSAMNKGVRRRRALLLQKRIAALQQRIENGVTQNSKPEFISVLRDRMTLLQHELEKLNR